MNNTFWRIIGILIVVASIAAMIGLRASKVYESKKRQEWNSIQHDMYQSESEKRRKLEESTEYKLEHWYQTFLNIKRSESSLYSERDLIQAKEKCLYYIDIREKELYSKLESVSDENTQGKIQMELLSLEARKATILADGNDSYDNDDDEDDYDDYDDDY